MALMKPAELSKTALLAEIARVLNGASIGADLALRARSLGDTVLVTVSGDGGDPSSFSLDVASADAAGQVGLDQLAAMPIVDGAPGVHGDDVHLEACEKINALYELHADTCGLCCQLSGEFCDTGFLIQHCIDCIESAGTGRSVEHAPRPQRPATAASVPASQPRTAVDQIGDLLDRLSAAGQTGELLFCDRREGDTLHLGIFDRAGSQGISLRLPLMAS